MKTLRLAWLLLRLVRRIGRDAARADIGASFTLTVEGGEGYDELCRVARANGQPAPERRRAWEVNYWPKLSEPATTRRGETPDVALATVLRDR